MKLTKLSAARLHGRPAWLVRTCRLMPAPPRQHAGTASQLIPGVRRTRGECKQASGLRRQEGHPVSTGGHTGPAVRYAATVV
jgi:hypothetical protein